jgi:hypothetical protein
VSPGFCPTDHETQVTTGIFCFWQGSLLLPLGQAPTPILHDTHDARGQFSHSVQNKEAIPQEDSFWRQDWHLSLQLCVVVGRSRGV